MNLPEVLLLAFFYLGMPVAFALGLYWVVRLAVRHELQRQATSPRPAPQPVDRAEP